MLGFNGAACKVPFCQDLEIGAILDHTVESGLDSLADSCQRGISAVCLTAGDTDAFLNGFNYLPNDLELVWQTGTLLSSTTGVLGIYNPVAGASAPYYRVTPGPTPTFYRVRF